MMEVYVTKDDSTEAWELIRIQDEGKSPRERREAEEKRTDDNGKIMKGWGVTDDRMRTREMAAERTYVEGDRGAESCEWAVVKG